MVCLPRRLIPFTAAAAFIPLPVLAAEIDVPLDNVMTITLDRPATTFYVGNPTIAGITVVDARHVFVLGKSFGTTNLITLDAEGRETLNEQVIVTNRPGTEITVQRGNYRTTMMCTPEHCQAAPAPGDDATDKHVLASPPFNMLTDEGQKHTDNSIKAASDTGAK